MKNSISSISKTLPSVRSRVKIRIKSGAAEFCTFNNLSDDKEHIALIFEAADKQDVPIVRLHSECLTGDVFGSHRCDCGFQLDEALSVMSERGGILLYLRQEGRGIGLYEKLAAYDLQISKNMDTYAANTALGHKEDTRDFEIASQILKALGIEQATLLSNNPEKSKQLEKNGIKVVQTLHTQVFVHDGNKEYLSAKADSGRHIFKDHPKDVFYMQKALDLAQEGLGRTFPNPSVGCCIVKDDVILAVARTADSGRPHAEIQALQEAGEKARGADLYVTLEPCHHYGQTPPCVDAIIEAGIKRVIITCEDPHPDTNGKSIAKLKESGIEVTYGVLEDVAREINQGFFLTVTQQRPFVTLKLATTLDGKIAAKTGQSKWITNELSRQKVHQMRAMHDAVLVGSGTFLADKPDLRPRNIHYNGPDKKRYVLDRSLKLESDFEGFQVVSDQSIDSVLQSIAAQGVTRLLVEGGGKIFSSFLSSGLWDELYWFRAAKVLGDDGIPAFEEFDFADISQSYQLRLKDTQRFDDDILEVWTKG